MPTIQVRLIAKLHAKKIVAKGLLCELGNTKAEVGVIERDASLLGQEKDHESGTNTILTYIPSGVGFCADLTYS